MARINKEKKQKVKKPIYKRWWFWAIIVFLAIGVFGGGESGTEAPSQDNSSIEQKAVEEEQAETKEDKETKKESSKKAESDDKNELTPGTDMEIICREGHPTYYGSVEESHKFWKKDKKKIVFGDSVDKATEKTILVMDAYRDSDLIRGVLIDFENFDENPKLTIDDALPIAATYLPFDVINEYYEYRGSRKIVPKEDKDSATNYVVTYGLTDEGSKAYSEKKHDYSGSIDVIFEETEGRINTFSIGFGTPKWMGFLDKNEYDEEEWKVDLNDYK